MDSARRLAYRLNDRQEIELWLWPGLDIAPGALDIVGSGSMLKSFNLKAIVFKPLAGTYMVCSRVFPLIPGG